MCGADPHALEQHLDQQLELHAAIDLRTGSRDEQTEEAGQHHGGQSLGIDILAQLAALADDASGLGDLSPVGRAMALAADGGHFAAHGEPAQAPFVAAVAAGHAATRHADSDQAFEAAFAAERVYQSGWIGNKLGLS